jgi:O-antigen/teichoic acid export membrane protein
MNFMIVSIGMMYVYWMVVRDLMIPVAYSELVDHEFRDNMLEQTISQSTILGIFTYFTALLFLTMYYYFANRREPDTAAATPAPTGKVNE